MSLETTISRYTGAGSYSIVGKTGTMAAGLSAASPIFSFRWATGTANAKALIDRISVSVASLGTGFTAGVGYVDAVMARAFTVTDYGGVTAPTMTSAVASETGGTLAAASYYYKVTAIGPWGESAASAESSAATIAGSTGSVVVTYGNVAGATTHRVYRGVATGAQTVYYEDTVSTFTDTGAAATAGVPLADGTIGGLTLTTNNGKRRTSMDPTLVSGIRVSSTAALVAGTRTLDDQGFGSVQFGVSTATNAVHLATTDIWKPDSREPQVLSANEGFVLRATVPATGTWQGIVTVEWREVYG